MALGEADLDLEYLSVDLVPLLLVDLDGKPPLGECLGLAVLPEPDSLDLLLADAGSLDLLLANPASLDLLLAGPGDLDLLLFLPGLGGSGLACEGVLVPLALGPDLSLDRRLDGCLDLDLLLLSLSRDLL